MSCRRLFVLLHHVRDKTISAHDGSVSELSGPRLRRCRWLLKAVRIPRCSAQQQDCLSPSVLCPHWAQRYLRAALAAPSARRIRETEHFENVFTSLCVRCVLMVVVERLESEQLADRPEVVLAAQRPAPTRPAREKIAAPSLVLRQQEVLPTTTSAAPLSPTHPLALPHRSTPYPSSHDRRVAAPLRRRGPESCAAPGRCRCGRACSTCR
jgi:hypothetical protein